LYMLYHAMTDAKATATACHPAAFCLVNYVWCRKPISF
jgi:hypothetical protein